MWRCLGWPTGSSVGDVRPDAGWEGGIRGGTANTSPVTRHAARSRGRRYCHPHRTAVIVHPRCPTGRAYGKCRIRYTVHRGERVCRNRGSSPNPRRDGRESSNFRYCPGWTMRWMSRPWRRNAASSANLCMSGDENIDPTARMHCTRSAGQTTVPVPLRRPAPRHRRWKSAPSGNGSRNLNEKSASSRWAWIFFARPLTKHGIRRRSRRRFARRHVSPILPGPETREDAQCHAT